MDEKEQVNVYFSNFLNFTDIHNFSFVVEVQSSSIYDVVPCYETFAKSLTKHFQISSTFNIPPAYLGWLGDCPLERDSDLNSSLTQKLSVSHVNCRSVSVCRDGISRFEALQSAVLLKSIEICSISETWLSGEDIPQVSSLYNWVGRNRPTRGGGVGILIHNFIDFSDITDRLLVNLDISFEFCAISFVRFGRSVCFISVYLPQSSDVRDFEALYERISIFGFDVVIFSGDWNSWHTAWGSDASNERGEILMDIFSRCDLNPTRMPGPTRMGDCRQHDTVVDFFVSSRGTLVDNVCIDFPLADHFFISCDICFSGVGTSCRRKVFDFRNTWLKRRDQLDKYFDSISAEDLFLHRSFDSIPDILNNGILKGWEEIGICKYINKHSKPWFTPKAKFHRRRARYWERQRFKCKRDGKPRVIEGRSYSLAECDKRRCDELHQYFSEVSRIVSDCDDFIGRLLDSDVHATVKRVYRSGRKAIPNLKTKTADNRFKIVASTDRQRADIFNARFLENTEFPHDLPSPSGMWDDVYCRVSSLSDHYYFQDGILSCDFDFGSLMITDSVFSDVRDFCHDFTLGKDTPNNPNTDFISLAETRFVRQGLKKGVGSSGINNDHIRKLTCSGIDKIFCFVFNLFFLHGYWPIGWRQATIFPLIKGGIRDAWNAAHYRGISIIDTVAKFLERLVYFRMKDICCSSIHSSQSGGLAQNGSVQQIIRVISSVEEHVHHTDWDEKGHEYRDRNVIMALLDCSKAFDRMHRAILLDKVWKIGIRDKLFVFLVAYFYNRQQRVKVGDHVSGYCTTRNGGPQGSVIVLFVWLIYINDISSKISECDFGLFVDDVILWLSDTNPSRAISRLNYDLNRIYGWQIFNTMIFDFQKFNLLDVGSIPVSSEMRSLATFGDGNPPWVSKTKYLGVLLDDKLSFVPFLKEIYDRLDKNRWRVTNHSNPAYGASPRTLEIIFSTWLFPIVEYGSPIWIFRIKDFFHYDLPVIAPYISVWKKLNSFYVQMCKTILGVDFSTSNIAALVRLGWMPLDYAIAYRAIIWLMKIRLGKAGISLLKQHKRIIDPAFDEVYASSSFYKPAVDFISRLITYMPSGTDFWKLNDLKKIKRLLFDAIYSELTILWQSSDEAPYCHVIHKEWKPRKWRRKCFSRRGSSLYHQVAVDRGKLNYRSEYSNNRCKTLSCRFGCNLLETPSHIFLYCPVARCKLSSLRSSCFDFGLEYCLETLFTDTRLQVDMERFLQDLIPDGFG